MNLWIGGSTSPIIVSHPQVALDRGLLVCSSGSAGSGRVEVDISVAELARILRVLAAADATALRGDLMRVADLLEAAWPLAVDAVRREVRVHDGG